MEKINDSLAKDLYPLIFRNLSIDDLFNCRLVNKQFKYFSDHTNCIYKLVIGRPDLKFDNYYWYYNNKFIEDQDIISLKCFKLIKSKSIFNLDKNLKYLKIYDQQFELKELSNLMNLEYIELSYEINNRNQQIINLNNLKVFASENLSIKLITLKLEKIQFNNINNIQLDCNPESIKHLITWNYDNGLEIFKNLEIIELDTNQSINENLLIIFKNLKQLKIFEFYSNERIENSLIKIFNDKIKLRREIEIYLKGIKIENIDKLNELNELKANVNSIWKFKLNNYDLLDSNLSFIHSLYYNQLEECVNNIENDLPSTFFDKFQNIHQVDVYSLNDVNGLNWFLNNLQYLITLITSSNLSLGQVFYNNLPNTIKFLYINSIEDINYDFILKLSKLIDFSTFNDEDLFDLAFTSFLNLKYLKKFIFFLKKRRYTLIEKRDKYFYLNEGEKLDYNQLVKKCNLIRSI